MKAIVILPALGLLAACGGASTTSSVDTLAADFVAADRVTLRTDSFEREVTFADGQRGFVGLTQRSDDLLDASPGIVIGNGPFAPIPVAGPTVMMQGTYEASIFSDLVAFGRALPTVLEERYAGDISLEVDFANDTIETTSNGPLQIDVAVMRDAGNRGSILTLDGATFGGLPVRVTGLVESTNVRAAFETTASSETVVSGVFSASPN